MAAVQEIREVKKKASLPRLGTLKECARNRSNGRLSLSDLSDQSSLSSDVNIDKVEILFRFHTRSLE